MNDRLFEVAKLEDLEGQIPAIRDYVELVFLLRLLYGYFVVGYRNYASMLEYFSRMQVDGFQIGTTEFSPSSRITREWRQLAMGMESLLTEGEIAQYVIPTLSTDQVIRRILLSRRDEHLEPDRE